MPFIPEKLLLIHGKVLYVENRKLNKKKTVDVLATWSWYLFTKYFYIIMCDVLAAKCEK